MARKGAKKPTSRRFTIIFWSLAGFYSLGYFPTAMFHNPIISMSAAACVIIPYGGRCNKLRQAMIRGLGLGFVAGAGIWSALLGGRELPPELARMSYVYIGATSFMCFAVAVVFCRIARRRRQELQKGWDELD